MANAALFEKRLLVGFTALTLLGYLFEIIAVSTDNWLLLSIEGGVYINATNKYLVKLYSGFWRTCKISWLREGDPTTEGMCIAAPFRPVWNVPLSLLISSS